MSWGNRSESGSRSDQCIAWLGIPSFHASGSTLLCHGLVRNPPCLSSLPILPCSGAPLVAAFLPTEAHLQEVQSFDDRRRCRVCGATFTSRTKLFDHLRGSGHEADQPNPAAWRPALGRGI